MNSKSNHDSNNSNNNNSGTGTGNSGGSHRRRLLSGMPDDVVFTPYLARGVEVAHAVVTDGTIGVFDGPVGTGKSTAMEWAVSQLDCDSVKMQMPSKATPLTALQTVCSALTGNEQDGNGRELGNLAISLLKGWRGLMAVDEVQTVGTAGMLQLQWMHDMCRGSFGLLLVGHGTRAAVSANATLASRAVEEAVFQQLEGRDLVDVLADLDPRLAATAPSVLARIDHKHCLGRLRDWADILNKLDRLHPDATRVTGKIANDLLAHVRRTPLQDPLGRDHAGGHDDRFDGPDDPDGLAGGEAA